MIDNSSIVIEEEVLKTSSEMLIPNLSENLPSFLTEYNWSILLSELYNKEYEDILYVIYKFLEKLYPDQSNYSDVLEYFELNDIFLGVSKTIGYNPDYKFLIKWSESILGTNRLYRNELAWRIQDLETISYRRKYYGSYLGYEMIFSSLRKHGSVYLVGKYGDQHDHNHKRYFRLVDANENRIKKFLPINEAGNITSYPHTGFLDGYDDELNYQIDFPNSFNSTSWNGLKKLNPSYNNKTIVLDVSLDKVLKHLNSKDTSKSLIDTPWLDYVKQESKKAKRINETIKIGSQLTIVVDTSGFYTKISNQNFTHPETEVKAFIFNKNYEENSNITKIRLGTAGSAKTSWFRSIDDIASFPLFGDVSTYGANFYIDTNQLQSVTIDQPTAYDISGFNVENEVFESYIDKMEYVEKIYDKYDFINTMVYSENVKNAINPNFNIKILPNFLDSVTTNNGQTTSQNIGKQTYDFTYNYDTLTGSSLLDRQLISCGDLIIHHIYEIVSIGTSNNWSSFAQIGGVDLNPATVGNIFTATAAGIAGYGTVYDTSESYNITQNRLDAITTVLDFKRRKVTPGSINCSFIISPNFLETSTKITKVIQSNANKDYTYNYGITTPGPIIPANDIEIGSTYKILTIGTSNYSILGSGVNSIGNIFNAHHKPIRITKAISNAGIATLSFSAESIVPFPVGSTIAVDNLGSYNGVDYEVTSSTNHSVSFELSGTNLDYEWSSALISQGTTNININSANSTGTHAILTFDPSLNIPFIDGSTIVISGMGSYNGSYTVTKCTNYSVSFLTSLTIANNSYIFYNTETLSKIDGTKMLGITGAVSSGTTITLTFPIQDAIPFTTSTSVFVSDMGSFLPTGVYTVSLGTLSTVTISYSSTASTYTFPNITNNAILTNLVDKGTGTVYDIGVQNVIPGKVYKILYVGTTTTSNHDFIKAGASKNKVGTIFLANPDASALLGTGGVEDLGTPLTITDKTSFEDLFWVDDALDEVNPLWQYLFINDIYDKINGTWSQKIKILKKKKITSLQGSFYDWEDITNGDEAYIRIEKPLTYHARIDSGRKRYVSQNRSFMDYDNGILSFIAIGNSSYDNLLDHQLPVRENILTTNSLNVIYSGLNYSKNLRSFAIKVTGIKSINQNNIFAYNAPETLVSNIDYAQDESFVINDSYKILYLGNTDWDAVGATYPTSDSYETESEYAIAEIGTSYYESIGAKLVSIASIVNGTEYIIKTTGGSDFTLAGAANSDPETIFTANYPVIEITGSSTTLLNVATLTFSTLAINPFPIGSKITVSKVGPGTGEDSYNGVKTVTDSTTSSVSFSCTASDATYTGRATMYEGTGTGTAYEVLFIAKVPYIDIISSSGDGYSATLTFSPQSIIPFPIGSMIEITGLASIYNGEHLVTDCTLSTVIFDSTATGSYSGKARLISLAEDGKTYNTEFTALSAGSGTGSATRIMTSWINKSSSNFITNCTKDLSDPLSNSIVGISEMALFNSDNNIVMYANFPQVIYDSVDNHMSFNIFIKKSPITVTTAALTL